MSATECHSQTKIIQENAEHHLPTEKKKEVDRLLRSEHRGEVRSYAGWNSGCMLLHFGFHWQLELRSPNWVCIATLRKLTSSGGWRIVVRTRTSVATWPLSLFVCRWGVLTETIYPTVNTRVGHKCLMDWLRTSRVHSEAQNAFVISLTKIWPPAY